MPSASVFVFRHLTLDVPEDVLVYEYKNRYELFMEKAHRNLDDIGAKIAAPATPTKIDNQDLLDALQQVNDTIA